MTEAEQAFLTDLTELTRKHKITIGGCGCCGSPHLTGHNEIDPIGHYVLNTPYRSEVRWIDPNDYYWTKNKAGAQ